MNPIREYYNAIVDGEVVTSDRVRRVYKHLVEKLENPGQYIYDKDRAALAVDFIEMFCKHSKGKWSGKPVILELWQKALVSALFGFIDKDTKLREYTELILIVARKNGKSTLSAAIGLYLLIADGEMGAEIYSAATKRDQAKIIWEESANMIKKSKSLSRVCSIRVNKIISSTNEGKFIPLSSESNRLDGLNVHGALIDELHAITDKNLYDVIVDGMSAREQPLTVITSTAGTVRENIYDIKYDEACQVVDGYDDPEGYQNERILPIVYELDQRKEWTDPSCWQKANPGLGTIKKIEQLADKVKTAQNNPIYVTNLLTKDFNVRETSSEAFLTFEQLNNTSEFEIRELKPRYGIGGIDLSATTDLTCATMLFMVPNDPVKYVKQMYWIPEEVFDKRVAEDKVPYDVWYKRGFIRKSPGNRIDYRLIVDWFTELQQEDDIYLYKCGYDGWSAAYFVEDMKNEFGRSVMEAVIQGKKTLSGPMKALGAELEGKRINYGNNPVLKWCMANVEIDIDRNGNIQPVKSIHAKKRIDGFASLLDAYVQYERCQEDYHNII